MAHSPSQPEYDNRLLWHTSVACFLLAGLTGFLYRLGMLGWIPADLALDNIRHAHSHLMFFGWAVPLPLYIIMQKMISRSSQPKGVSWMKYSIGATLLFGLMAYPFFLLYGYRPVHLGTATMPLSVIFSGLVMISWYGFMVGYWKNRDTLGDDQYFSWFAGALTLLAVCSLGAWGVAVIQELAPNSHLLMKGMTHFFLAAFTEGWVVLVLLGVLISELEIDTEKWPVSPQFALGSIAIGAPLTFPYGISESLLSPMLLGTARFGGGLAAIGLLMVLGFIFKAGKGKHSIWIWPILLLVLKGILQLATSIIPSSFWLSDPGLRVLYLHILLLGGLTLLAIGWTHVKTSISKNYFHGIGITIIITLATLLMPTGFWPQEFSGVWIFYTLTVGALLPVLAVGAFWIRSINAKKA